MTASDVHTKFYKGSGDEKPPSFLSSLIKDYLVRGSDLEVFALVNIIVLYLFLLLIIGNVEPSYIYLAIYPAALFIAFRLRKSHKEKARSIIAHRMPFFADSIANALAVGCTLSQAFEQSVYYLKGDFKDAFERVMLKNSLGKQLGPLLHELEKRYPKTGLKYLISLLEEYQELGIGISPLLKRIAEALKVKEESEEKIKTILSAGSSYAKISIIVFGISFSSFGFMLKDQIGILLGPTLKPALIMLSFWAIGGMLIVMRITSLEFSTHYSLRPTVKAFMEKKRWTINELLDYCGLMENLNLWRKILLYTPLFLGFMGAYFISLYNANLLTILVAYALSIMIARMGIEFILKGLIEDQLIRAVETFPDFLQIFVIGLNSGLNQFKAFEFAEKALEGSAPELLQKELSRTKSALLYGEKNAIAWQRLMNRLPFETIVDFSELMIISPLHGESITKSIEQLMSSYQSKKLNLVEKKATKLGQMVVPIIVIALFPLFLFAVFGPLWIKISGLFNE